LLFVAAIVGLTILVMKKFEVNTSVSSSPSIKDNFANVDSEIVQSTAEKKEINSALDEVREEYKTVDTLLLFVGYSRSRHTLLASLLDGHPHMIVGNERNILYRLIHGKTMSRNEMFDELVKGSKAFMKGGKGMVMKGNLQNTEHFGFFMEGYWQGTYDKYIKVIGDKTAWLTSGIFRNMPHDTVTGVIDEIEKQYRVKTKFIHLIRNPFDIISTITLRHNNRRFGNHSDKVDDPDLLERSMERVFRWAEGSAVARELLGDKLLDVNGLDLVQKPVETLSKICQFIEITCSADYLQACAKVVDPDPSITRNYVVWSKEHLNRVYSEIEQYPFLAHYTYED